MEPAVLIARITVKEDESLSLTIRSGGVVLAPTNDKDKYQFWVKDKRYTNGVKDANGFPSFAIINEATREAINYNGARGPVQLVPYNPKSVDTSILWTEGDDIGEGFRHIRLATDTSLVLDALHETSSRVQDGTRLGIWTELTADNQKWKIKRWTP